MTARGSKRDRRLAAIEGAAKPKVERAQVILYDVAKGPPSTPDDGRVVFLIPRNGREGVQS
jgi:hypothetical protein